MAIQSNFPAIKPTLLLDFANTKQLDPRITFTRASTGTYYDGKTVAKAEENLLLQSQTFDTTWTVASSGTALTITANALNAPDGTTTAEQLTNTATTLLHRLSQPVAAVRVSTQYAISFFAKNNNAGFIAVSLYDDTSFTRNAAASFNLSTGAVGTTSASGTGYSVDSTSITETPAGSGWYRCTAVVTVGSTCTTPSITFAVQTASTLGGNYGLGSAYLGAGESIYLWGAQLEQRSSVTAYTATTTQPITNYIPVLLTAASGVARFEHNPTTGESLGLEIEESRTNLVTYSEQFDNAAWGKFAVTVTAGATIAPSGALTADAVTLDATNAIHEIYTTFTSVSGTTYTGSYFVKAGTHRYVQLLGPGAIFTQWANFDLQTGTRTAGTTGFGAIQAVGNGWYRISLSAAAASSSSVARISLALIESGTAARAAGFTGDGYSGIFIWGAQLEAGAFPTSYIPTVASQVTRAADAASMTGANFSSWYRADEGTLYAESTVIAFSANQTVFTISDNVGSTSTQNMNIRHSGSTSGVSRASINNSISQFDSVVNVSQGVKKLALAYQADNALFAVNGASGVVDTSVSLPNSVSQAQFGTATFLNSTLNGTIKKIAYYPARVTNAQLQALTS